MFTGGNSSLLPGAIDLPLHLRLLMYHLTTLRLHLTHHLAPSMYALLVHST